MSLNNKQSKYTTRSTIGRSMLSANYAFAGQKLEADPYSRTVRRSLFNSEASASKGKSPATTFHTHAPMNKKPRSRLGRRKSLGLNLGHDAVTSQCEFITNKLVTTSLGDSVTKKNVITTRNTRKSLFPAVLGLRVNNDLYKERTDLRKDLIQKRFLRNITNDFDNAVPVGSTSTSTITSGSLPQISETTNKIYPEKIILDPVIPVEGSGLDNSTNSVNEFLSLEQSVMLETHCEVGTIDIAPLAPVVEENSDLNSSKENNLLLLPKSCHSEDKTAVSNEPSDELTADHNNELMKVLLEKMLDYNKLIDAANNKWKQMMKEYNELYEAAGNKWKEVKEIEQLLKGGRLETQVCAATPSILKTSRSKSARKMLSASVKFNNQVTTDFVAPQTPLSTSKKIALKKKSISYTPKSVKKIMNSQMEQLCNI